MGYSLFHSLCNESFLFSAWKKVKAKQSAGGVDRITVETFGQNVDKEIKMLVSELKAGKWIPEPYLKKEIPKKTKEMRTLGLLSVRDKVVQQAIKMLIEPKFENVFFENSYGYRPDKGHTKAVRRALHECQKQENRFILRLDIDNYFDTVNHEILFQRLRQVVKDEEVVRLVELCTKMGMVTNKNKWKDVTSGVPQGAVLSPLLANLYMNSFDQFVLSKTNSYVRYADDFIILCHDETTANDILQRATTYLSEKLLLKLNVPSVTPIEEGFEFLGIFINPQGLCVTTKKRQDLEQRIDEVDIKNGVFVKDGLEGLLGINRYYAKLLPQEILEELDNHLVEHLNEVVSRHASEFKSQAALKEILKEITYSSVKCQLESNSIITSLLAVYKASKKTSDKDQNDVIINQRKQEYRKKEREGAELVINTPGASIGVSQGKMTVRQQGKVIHKQNVANLSHITIVSPGVLLSSNAVRTCVDEKIPVDFFDNKGRHYASVLSNKYMSCSLWRKQILMPYEQRVQLASSIIMGKLKNQLNLVKYFHKYHKNDIGVQNAFTKTCEEMDSYVDKLKNATSETPMQEINTCESQGALAYWNFVKTLLADDSVEFENRERQGASDLVNSMLNYGYAFLYSRIWEAVLGAGLNPYESVIHVRQDGKPTFVYDMVEVFRPQAVDRVVFSLVQKRSDLKMDGALLANNTKELLVKGVLDRFQRYEKYRGVEMRLEQIFIEQSREVAAFIENGEKYKPYLAKW